VTTLHTPSFADTEQLKSELFVEFTKSLRTRIVPGNIDESVNIDQYIGYDALHTLLIPGISLFGTWPVLSYSSYQLSFSHFRLEDFNLKTGRLTSWWDGFPKRERDLPSDDMQLSHGTFVNSYPAGFTDWIEVDVDFKEHAIDKYWFDPYYFPGINFHAAIIVDKDETWAVLPIFGFKTDKNRYYIQAANGLNMALRAGSRFQFLNANTVITEGFNGKADGDYPIGATRITLKPAAFVLGTNVLVVIGGNHYFITDSQYSGGQETITLFTPLLTTVVDNETIETGQWASETFYIPYGKVLTASSRYFRVQHAPTFPAIRMMRQL
jgi:hypothetical protein